MPKAINLTAQRESSRAVYVILVAKYAVRVIGIESKIAYKRVFEDSNPFTN
tara:strand:+ start:313 stop:465 length:153 start_codon:yes stop_codon:yes gene_type:complete